VHRYLFERGAVNERFGGFTRGADDLARERRNGRSIAADAQASSPWR
jgi:hypothetical protein